MQDELIDLDDVTKLENSDVFLLTPLSTRVEESYPELLMGLSFESNLDLTVIERTGYTILDVLSDIGGILSVLISGAAIPLSLWNHNNFDYALVTRFFKLKSSEKTYTEFVPTKFCNLCEYIFFCEKCCLRDRKYRGM